MLSTKLKQKNISPSLCIYDKHSKDNSTSQEVISDQHPQFQHNPVNFQDLHYALFPIQNKSHPQFLNYKDATFGPQKKHLLTFSQSSVDFQQQNRIQIISRFKPIVSQKINEQTIGINDTTVHIRNQQSITLDRVFNQSTSQSDIFQKIGKKHLGRFLNGLYSTIISYGQTGSGKTYTLYGNLKKPNQFGLIPRIVQQLYAKQPNFKLGCQMIEVYQEKIKDLLNISQTKQLKIKEEKENINVVGSLIIQTQNSTQALNVIKSGYLNRKLRSTKLNQNSSRSHILLILHNFSDRRHNKLCFVDLAGSEKINKSGVKGMALQQAKKINYSLSCLGSVINNLIKGSEHIPYRNSKLTRVLQNYLCSQGFISFLATCSRSQNSYEETISTLKFLKRVKDLPRKPTKEQANESDQNWKEIIVQLTKQLQQTKSELNKLKMEQQITICSGNKGRIMDRPSLPIAKEGLVNFPIQMKVNFVKLSRKTIKINCVLAAKH